MSEREIKPCKRCGKGKSPMCQKCMIEVEKLFKLSTLDYDVVSNFWKGKSRKEILEGIKWSSIEKLVEIHSMIKTLERNA